MDYFTFLQFGIPSMASEEVDRYKKIMDWLDENTLCCTIRKDIQWNIPILRNNRIEPEIEALSERGWIIEYPLKRKDFNSVTLDFWTCGCITDFVHHKGKQDCPLCGKTVATSDYRLPYIWSVLATELWDFRGLYHG